MQHIQEVGRPHPYAAPVPPINSQQNFIKPPIVGEQNLSNSQMHSHLLSAPPVDHSQIMSPPTTGVHASQIPPSRLPIDPHGHGQPPMGYQAHGTNLPNASLQQQPGIPPYNPVPPLPSQVVASPQTDGDSSQFAPPLSTTGQPIANPPGAGYPQARQKQYLPPMPGQNMMGPVTPGNLPQPGQRQYGSTMPPLPGQALSSPLGMNRASPGINSGYQQPAYQQPGYHNQMVQSYI